MDQKQLGVRSRAFASTSPSSEPTVPFPSASTSNPIFASCYPNASSSSSPNHTPTSETPGSGPSKSNLAERYLSFIHLAPGVMKLIGERGKFVGIDEEYNVVKEYTASSSHEPHDEKVVPMARTASDFSYSCNRYAGDRWRIIGDAGGASSA